MKLRFGVTAAEKKAWIVFFVLLGLTAAVLIISAGLGQRFIPPWDVAKTFFGAGSKLDELMIMSFRLPRILTALCAGVCLAAAGAILQGLVRNPLASPDIIGITGGAAVAVVLVMMFFTDRSSSLTISLSWLPAAAFIGASAVGLIVYLLAYKNGASTFRLVLIGIGFSMSAQALTTLLMIKGPIYRASQANVYITGSVYGSNWKYVKMAIILSVILIFICFIALKNMNIQVLGEDIAAGAGSAVQRNRFFLLLLSTALTGCAVSVAGTIGFVGLMAPHIARRLVGSSYGALLPASALIGALLVLTADIVGRTLFAPVEVPAGVFTAAIGAPYFIYLLYKTRNT